ncbi:MAG: insulinase family protein [Deltaproteobacteria bacterium]|nr:insulinase family protein [Deltaproteobacteria bacterium]
MLKKRLANGVTVIVQKRNLTPVVAIQTWVRFGSADEPEQRAGVAHVIEHMLFKGSQGRPAGELAKKVEAAGGQINAWTSFDQTVYHLVVPSARFNTALALLANAVTKPAFDADELAREKQVILEELRQGEDRPGHLCSERLFRSAFRQHPYGRPIIGYRNTVEGIGRRDLVDVHRHHYRGPNVTVSVTGDIDEIKGYRLVAKHFAALPSAHHVGTRPVEPEQRRHRTVCQSASVEELYVMAGFHIPGLKHPDTPACDLLSVILGQGDSSRLNVALRRRAPLCTAVYTYAYTPKDSGLFVLGATIPMATMDGALSGIGQELSRVVTECIDAHELDKAIQMTLADTLFQSETVQGEARRLGYYETLTGNPEYEQEYLIRMRSLTPNALLAVARKYLHPGNMTISIVHPKQVVVASPKTGKPIHKKLAGRVVTTQIRDRLTAALTVKSRPFSTRPPKRTTSGIYRHVTKSGATVLLMPTDGAPVTSMRTTWLGGLRAETRDRNGISNLTAEMLTRGTNARPGDAAVRQIESFGGAIDGSSGRNTIGLRTELPSEHWQEALDILIDCMTDPVFDPSEFALAREAALHDIEARQDDLATVAFDLFRSKLYGSHPYGMPLPGRKETVSALTARQVQLYHQRLCRPKNLVLAAAGDVDPAAFFDAVERLLPSKRLQAPKLPSRKIRFPKNPITAEAHRDRQQVHLVLGFPGTTVDSPDRYPLLVMMSILGGQGGRLFVNLRDKKGLAYQVAAYSVEGLDPGFLGTYIATYPDKVEVAVAGLWKELERLRDKPVGKKELEEVQNHLVGNHLIAFQRRDTMATSIALNELYGIGCDEHAKYEQRILNVSARDVKQSAQRYLDRKHSVLVLAGPNRPHRAETSLSNSKTKK